MADWIEEQNHHGGLISWTVVVRGRESENSKLGIASWLPESVGPVFNIARTRIKGSNSLGVITTAGDEAFGLSMDELLQAEKLVQAGVQTKTLNRAARLVRESSSGLLVLYPISRYSGHDDGSNVGVDSAREPLFSNPEDGNARDLIGISVSFPKAAKERAAQSYVEGTAKWKPMM